MSTPDTNKERAAQLRKPSGEEGIKTGIWMSHGNRNIVQDARKQHKAGRIVSILEIGMGHCFYVSKILNQKGYILYTGCDYSETMVAEAQKLNAEWILNNRACFLLTSAAELSDKAASFMKIISVNTIYFWDHPQFLLQEFKRVLMPNGKVIVGFRPIHQTKNYPLTKYEFTQYSLQDANELLQQNGFDMLKALENKEPDFILNGQAMSMENVVPIAA